ncbi:unnamed protein product [Mycena citricolor]|uniref:Protein kinase domain-containing protein n=1 Tax=Mycena citricolor TaxID=2018698 RepID=A0AAD2HCB2_9AGAR|nr:unnamed protein product [Mycena citricolor]
MFKSTNKINESAITLADFDVLNRIGQTSKSNVHLVKHKTTGDRFALKTAFRGPQSDRLHPAINEQATFKRIAAAGFEVSRSLLPLHASWEDESRYCFLSEWCAGRDLTSYLANGHKHWGGLSAPRVHFMFAQLVTALDSLHQLNIVHRDVRPANIFFTQDGNIVLGDFDVAVHLPGSLMNGTDEPAEIVFDVSADADSGSFFTQSWDEVLGVTRERCGTAGYMSPAQVQGTPYSFDADVYALGVVVHQLATGQMPSAETPELLATVDTDLAGVIRGLLDHNRDTRLTIAQLKEHRYFSNVNWKKMARHQVPAPWSPVPAYVPSTARKSPFPVSVTREGSPFEYVSPVFRMSRRGVSSALRRLVSRSRSKRVAPVPVPIVVIPDTVSHTVPAPPLTYAPKLASSPFPSLWHSQTVEKIAAMRFSVMDRTSPVCDSDSSRSSVVSTDSWSSDSSDLEAWCGARKPKPAASALVSAPRNALAAVPHFVSLAVDL